MGDSDQGFRCALWLQGDDDVPQLATLAERMRARAAAASDPADLPWARDDDTDLRAFLAAQPCPPFDRLRAVTAADVYEAEEAAFQKWRYQMRLLVAALRSDAMAAASKVCGQPACMQSCDAAAAAPRHSAFALALHALPRALALPPVLAPRPFRHAAF